jgi:Ca-activated chloride channel family protein
MGEPFVVTEPGEASETAERFRRYIDSPVLTNIRVSFEGFATYDVEPAVIPDLFASRPVVLLGKWRGRRRGRITLSGDRGGEAYRQIFTLAETVPLETHGSLGMLWARKRLGRLSDLHTGPPDDERRSEIATIGLTYNLLTSETSFIAVHEAVRNPDTPAEAVTQPLPLPRQVSNLAVSGRRVPEPELMLLLALMGLWVLRRCAPPAKAKRQAGTGG